MNPLEAALRYVEAGFAVFPIRPGTKAPIKRLTPHGYKNATPNPQLVRDWWGVVPSAGIGLPCRPNGFVVLDEDPRNGGDLAALTAQIGSLPRTPVQLSGRGEGRHVLFQDPGGQLPGEVAAGIDLKVNGYIVVAPSLHPDTGQPYRWLVSPFEVDPAPMPPALLALVRGNVGRSTGAEGPLKGGASSDAVIRKGTQHRTLLALSCSMRARGLSREATFAAVLHENETRCEAPGTEAYVRRLVDDVFTRYDVDAHTTAYALLRRALFDLYAAGVGGLPEAGRLGGDGDGRSTPPPVGVLVSEVERERFDWLWKPRLALRKMTMLDGDPGLGKSTLYCEIAARLTTGRGWPDGPGAPNEPGNVIIVTSEDGIGDTIRPRLEEAGADLDRVKVIASVPVWDASAGTWQPSTPTIPEHLPQIESAVDNFGACLLVIDPLFAHLSGKVNSYRDQDVRRALTPLGAMAERLNVSVLIVRHLNKMAGGSVLYRGGGSIGIIGAVRLGLLLGKHPDEGDEDTGRRVLAPTKANIAKHAEAFAFRLQSSPRDPEVAVIRWEGTCAITAQELVRPPSARRETKQDEAAAWLRERLSGGDPHPARDLYAEAEGMGFSERTLKRAKRTLGVVVEQIPKRPGGTWYWSLSGGEADEAAAQKRPEGQFHEDGPLAPPCVPESALTPQKTSIIPLHPQRANGREPEGVGPLADPYGARLPRRPPDAHSGLVRHTQTQTPEGVGVLLAYYEGGALVAIEGAERLYPYGAVRPVFDAPC